MKNKEFLEHFGVKGMRWGVVHDETTSGRRAKLKEQRKAKGLEGSVKDLTDPDEAKPISPKGWRPTKKQLAYIGVGALATGAILYKLQSKDAPDVHLFSKEDYLKAMEGQERPSPDVLSLIGKNFLPTDTKSLFMSHGEEVTPELQSITLGYRAKLFPQGMNFIDYRQLKRKHLVTPLT